MRMVFALPLIFQNIKEITIGRQFHLENSGELGLEIFKHSLRMN